MISVVENGLGSLLDHLAAGLNIQHRQIVQSITYDSEHDQVRVEWKNNPVCVPSDESESDSNSSSELKDKADSKSTIYTANAVICTIPVGCLKESETKELHVDTEERLHIPTVRFQPPLPKEKREAIEGVEVGSVNKIMLVFERRFWSDNSFFGRINDKESARGEFFLFVSNPGSKVLSVYLAGGAANIGDNFSNEDLSTKLMQILGRIYGNDCPSTPKELIITSWHSNEFANGCFPYIPIGRTDEDYDILAKPVEVETASKTLRPYLFFAGDHTCREYPGRLHGAFLSGLREAARIADTFLGPVNAAEKQAEYEEIGQSFLKMFKQPVEEAYLSD